MLGNHWVYRKINYTTRFLVADIGGIGVVRLLIAPFSKKRELELARIPVNYVISLKIAQKVKIKIGAVSYLF